MRTDNGFQLSGCHICFQPVGSLLYILSLVDVLTFDEASKCAASQHSSCGLLLHSLFILHTHPLLLIVVVYCTLLIIQLASIYEPESRFAVDAMAQCRRLERGS